MSRFRLTTAVVAVERDFGHGAGQAVRGMGLDGMRLRHREAREAECQQEHRHCKPAQHAPALQTCLPVVSHRDHSAPPDTLFQEYTFAQHPALIQIKSGEIASFLLISSPVPGKSMVRQNGECLSLNLVMV